MMSKQLLRIASIASFISVILFLTTNETRTTVKYFPFHDHIFFEIAETNLSINQDQTTIVWESISTTSEPTYLRQDIALLYENGLFKAIQKKWEQQIDTIFLNENVNPSEKALLQAISYHHGEIHELDTITSVQQLSSASQYYIKENDVITSFVRANTGKEKVWRNKLNTLTNKRLFRHWQHLIDKLEIPADQYDTYSFIDFFQFGQTVFPDKTTEQYEKIVGQLWEGLYKSYVLLIDELDAPSQTHLMPFIMVHKDTTHLLVIYELDGKEHRLIQQISP